MFIYIERGREREWPFNIYESVVHEHQWIQPTSQPTTIILIIIIQQQQQQPKIEKTKVDIVDDGGEFQIRSSQISYVLPLLLWWWYSLYSIVRIPGAFRISFLSFYHSPFIHSLLFWRPFLSLATTMAAFLSFVVVVIVVVVVVNQTRTLFFFHQRFYHLLTHYYYLNIIHHFYNK